jgi:hypothetical protein
MIGSHIAGIGHSARIAACAVVFTFWGGLSGQAAAQAAIEPAPRNEATAAPGKAQAGKKPLRAGRAKKAGGAGASVLAAVPVAARYVPGTERDWDISVTDKTLNATMARWAALAGWQLLWELPVDYAVEARTRVHGTFEDAVGIVADSMESAEIPMRAVFYQGNRVLRIMAKGTE